MIKNKILINVNFYIIIMVLLCFVIILGGISYRLHPISFKTGYTNVLFTSAANWEIENSIIVNDTVNFCRPIGVNKQLIECVVENVGVYYNYTPRNETYPVIINVDEFDKKGYICRDIAVAYNAIFRKLGLGTDYVYSKNKNVSHVYNNVYNQWGNNPLDCIVNMDEFICWG